MVRSLAISLVLLAVGAWSLGCNTTQELDACEPGEVLSGEGGAFARDDGSCGSLRRESVIGSERLVLQSLATRVVDGQPRILMNEEKTTTSGRISLWGAAPGNPIELLNEADISAVEQEADGFEPSIFPGAEILVLDGELVLVGASYTGEISYLDGSSSIPLRIEPTEGFMDEAGPWDPKSANHQITRWRRVGDDRLVWHGVVNVPFLIEEIRLPRPVVGVFDLVVDDQGDLVLEYSWEYLEGAIEPQFGTFRTGWAAVLSLSPNRDGLLSAAGAIAEAELVFDPAVEPGCTEEQPCLRIDGLRPSFHQVASNKAGTLSDTLVATLDGTTDEQLEALNESARAVVQSVADQCNPGFEVSSSDAGIAYIGIGERGLGAITLGFVIYLGCGENFCPRACDVPANPRDAVDNLLVMPEPLIVARWEADDDKYYLSGVEALDLGRTHTGFAQFENRDLGLDDDLIRMAALGVELDVIEGRVAPVGAFVDIMEFDPEAPFTPTIRATYRLDDDLDFSRLDSFTQLWVVENRILVPVGTDITVLEIEF